MKTIIAAMALVLLAIAGGAAQQIQYVENMHYTVLQTPIGTASPGKIEVREFFWYGSAHSAAIQPEFGQWLGLQPSDIAFVRTPAIWTPQMSVHATAFHALEALGKVSSVHGALFTEIHVRKNKLETKEAMATFVATQGVAKAQFDRVYSSFGVTAKVNQSQKTFKDARVNSVPSVVVAGKYLVLKRTGAPRDEYFRIIDFLVRKERLANR